MMSDKKHTKALQGHELECQKMNKLNNTSTEPGKILYL